MHDVDRLFKKARSESSKSKPKLKVNIEFRDKLSSIQPSDQWSPSIYNKAVTDLMPNSSVIE